MAVTGGSLLSGVVVLVIVAVIGYVVELILDAIGLPHLIGFLVFLLFVLYGLYLLFVRLR